MEYKNTTFKTNYRRFENRAKLFNGVESSPSSKWRSTIWRSTAWVALYAGCSSRLGLKIKINDYNLLQ